MTIENEYLREVYTELTGKDRGQTEFLQAVGEIFSDVSPEISAHPEYVRNGIPTRIVEPERSISFRVSWIDDGGQVRVARGFRVQFNSAIGPYKGGLRFHPSTNLSVMKFLAFEQSFKNALTGLPMGGGKGGADFDPKGKSDGEIMRFCQAFMTELEKHIGQFTDIPAGDIGVGTREIGYLFGQYKRLRNEHSGALTGKGLSIGGSLLRIQATGYGLCYLTELMLRDSGLSFDGMRAVVSGSGNVALYCAEKATELGATVIAMSDSSGYVFDPNGIDVGLMIRLKETDRARISEYARQVPSASFVPECSDIWSIACDIAMPCATQNEIDGAAASRLIRNGVRAVAEGANMPSTPEAIEMFRQSGVLFAPAKAANAGGVAVSGLEMTQNSIRLPFDGDKVDALLRSTMNGIYTVCTSTAVEYGSPKDLALGANISAFRRIAKAMLAQGITY